LPADGVEGVGKVDLQHLERKVGVRLDDGVDLNGCVGAGVGYTNPTLDGKKCGFEVGHEDMREDF
jgi:hypothetical protein